MFDSNLTSIKLSINIGVLILFSHFKHNVLKINLSFKVIKSEPKSKYYFISGITVITFWIFGHSLLLNCDPKDFLIR